MRGWRHFLTSIFQLGHDVGWYCGWCECTWRSWRCGCAGHLRLPGAAPAPGGEEAPRRRQAAGAHGSPLITCPVHTASLAEAVASHLPMPSAHPAQRHMRDMDRCDATDTER